MILEVKNVSKKFKDVEVLKKVNIKFKTGKIYGIIGRNGSGKSVFLKILCGFYQPTTGNVFYDGVDIVKSDIFPPNTRALIEKPHFLPDLTGLENLKLLASIQKKIGIEEIEKQLKLLNMFEEKDKKFSKYSLGTKQKLGLVQVLMEDPEVIILDEPLNGIENKTAKKFREIMKKEKNKGKIIIIASHIKDDIEELADEIYEVDDGNFIKK